MSQQKTSHIQTPNEIGNVIYAENIDARQAFRDEWPARLVMLVIALIGVSVFLFFAFAALFYELTVWNLGFALFLSPSLVIAYYFGIDFICPETGTVCDNGLIRFRVFYNGWVLFQKMYLFSKEHRISVRQKIERPNNRYFWFAEYTAHLADFLDGKKIVFRVRYADIPDERKCEKEFFVQAINAFHCFIQRD